MLVGSRWSPNSNWQLDRSSVALTLYFSDLVCSNLTDVDRLVTNMMFGITCFQLYVTKFCSRDDFLKNLMRMELLLYIVLFTAEMY